jgi:Holliday junction resolvasome RuvABC ATP-dependent DNA helicase subunit
MSFRQLITIGRRLSPGAQRPQESSEKKPITKELLKKYKWGWPTEPGQIQKEMEFFPYGEKPNDILRRCYSDPAYPICPFVNFIGNAHAVQKLSRIVFHARGNYNHCCKTALAFLGPTSTGKTLLAKTFAEALALPFVSFSGSAATSTDFMLEKINEVLTLKHNNPLVFEERPGHFLLPPMVVFIDEVHNLPNPVQQGLLTAIEFDDSYLTTPKGYSANTYNVTWVVATTDWGKVFDAFANRFSKIRLNYYTLAEMAKIIGLNNPGWDYRICELVAKYSGRVPRESLAFAREMHLEHEWEGGVPWGEIAAKVAKNNGIDEFGMTYQRVAVLKTLADSGPMGVARLGATAGVACKEEELRKFVLPPLMAAIEDQPALVEITTQGAAITEAGYKELEKRKIEFERPMVMG